ncbi:MAG: AMP-dependent synthetase and ligase [candidate division TM6 bacterium GW2011_GWF2_38_10]|nr:MAG: AMP-dependent synthetase and ligase [candidate division TM6 bacterium GW2011_GWF2_38_10]
MGQFFCQKKQMVNGLPIEWAVYEKALQALKPQGEFLFVGHLLQRAYQRYAEQLALIGASRCITYRELYIRSVMVSEQLYALGIQSGDSVVVCGENSLEFYVAYWAILQCGGIAVPVNTYLHERELTHIIYDSAPRFIICADALHEMFTGLHERSLIKDSIELLRLSTLVNWDLVLTQEHIEAADTYSIPQRDQDELALLLYTSGTTGLPKGVMLSSRNIMTNVAQVAARFAMCGLSAGERIFCVLPLFHVFAQNVCIWTPAMTGSAVIVVQKIDRKLILQGLRHKPTLFVGVPALYGLLCLMKTAPLESVRLFVSGADMLPDKIRLAFSLIYGRKIASGYGLTEASPVIAIHYENNDDLTQDVGSPLCELVCDVRNDEGESLACEQVGTLWVKGDNVMMGYYHDPEQTAKVLSDGWLNTGDLATINFFGKLAIKGRLKDVIIHKGFNIYPAEIENVLLRHPGVVKVAVIGHEESLNGQIPVAFIAAKVQGDELDRELKTLCMHNLATYKIPKRFIYVDDLPMNATGKIDKKQLRVY